MHIDTLKNISDQDNVLIFFEGKTFERWIGA